MSEKYIDPEFQDISPEQVTQLNKENEIVEPLFTSPESFFHMSPREYQNEIYQKAVQENTIAVLDTGAGKTLISVLLIKHMLAIERQKLETVPNYKKKLIFFLTEKVPLVFQQASVIKANCDASVELMCGEMNVDSWSKEKWHESYDNSDICVMTSQIFLDTLRKAFLKLEETSLIVFDECHHAVKRHSYKLIMEEFYERTADESRSKIFGMTASPINSSTSDIWKGVRDLEDSLHSKVYMALTSRELEEAVKKPFESVEYYSMKVINNIPPPKKIIGDRSEYYKALNSPARIELRYGRTQLTQRIELKIDGIKGWDNCLFVSDAILNIMGPWCVDRLWKIMLNGASVHGLYTPTDYNEAYCLALEESKRLQEAYSMCEYEDVPIPDVNNPDLFTDKARALIDCLQKIFNGANENFCGIIFVERRHTAVSIKLLIDGLGNFDGKAKCEILIGHGTGTGGDIQMKFRNQNQVIAKFREGKFNLLIATNVAEEGLDIQSCNYVIRFDLFKTLVAYIQSRGRARKKDSKYIMMVNTQDPKEIKLLPKFRDGEKKMKDYYRILPPDKNVANRFDFEDLHPENDLSKNMEGAYGVPGTRALITLSSSVALVYFYCSTLPADEFCSFNPIYEVTESEADQLFYCTLTLPINAALRNFECYESSKRDAKAKVSLLACIELHKCGAIDDHLMPTAKVKKQRIQNPEEEIDENGKQIGSRGRESYYPTSIPSFWESQNDNSYWISLFVIESSDPNLTKLSRSICLITRKPLPSIPEFELFKENLGFQVRVVPQHEKAVFEDNTKIKKLADYTVAVAQELVKKSFDCDLQDVPYFFAPLVRNIFPLPPRRGFIANSLESKIDWKEVNRLLSNDRKRRVPLDGIESASKDAIVIDVAGNRKQYFVENVDRTMSVLSVVPATLDGKNISIREQESNTFEDYYNQQEKLPLKITRCDQPLLRVSRIYRSKTYTFFKEETRTKKVEKDQSEPASSVVWLAPDLCYMYCISASVHRTLEILPTIMMRIDAVLHALGAQKDLCLTFIDDVLMLEAYTASSARMGMDYQRLEFLGDSVLKFITTIRAFVQFPSFNEYDLTEERMSMISNKALFKTAKQLHIYQYLTCQNIPLRLWRPPRFTSQEDSPEMIEKLSFKKLSDKTLADVIESTLGATYLSNFCDITTSLNHCLTTCQRLKVPLNDIYCWSDFQIKYNTGLLAKKEYITRLQNASPCLVNHAFSNKESSNVSRIEEILGYRFRVPLLAVEALTHASFVDSGTASYQRLEFLGDAVLDFCVTNYLYRKYKLAPPGILHDLRKSHMSDCLVGAMENFGSQCEAARKKGEDVGEYWLDFNAPKVLSDVVESLIGAVFVDSQFDVDTINELFARLVQPLLDKHISIESMKVHPVGKWKCMVQETGCTNYEIRNLLKPKKVDDNEQSERQKCIVFVHEKAFASGSGVNTKEARKDAASKACQRMLEDAQSFASLCNCRQYISRNTAFS